MYSVHQQTLKYKLIKYWTYKAQPIRTNIQCPTIFFHTWNSWIFTTLNHDLVGTCRINITHLLMVLNRGPYDDNLLKITCPNSGPT